MIEQELLRDPSRARVRIGRLMSLAVLGGVLTAGLPGLGLLCHIRWVAKSLHLTVTGEGIETAEQLVTLKESGCDLGQGYLYGRPLPADETGRLLLAQPPASRSAGAGLIALTGV